MNFSLINVGIADLDVSSSPDILRTILGSCVGICLYDSERKIGGLSHIMLPSIRSDDSPKKKYADTAIPILIEEMLKIGAKENGITAKIVGGSNMFRVTNKNPIMGDIGRKNIDSVKDILKELKIEIISEDVGGDYGRTIDFYLETGVVKVKSHGSDIKLI